MWIEIVKSLINQAFWPVTPRAGVWIEIKTVSGSCSAVSLSLPVRECGLKYVKHLKKKKEVLVTPRAGVWIEIHHGMRGVVYKWASLPVRECGLK